ncbi:MAG TPA: biotin synthase BioB [Candidatus Sulfotelmatobacter sp.]|nr:biotin synthase BioB [Candidatus Sulfotelmatobacter sp.]
MPASTELRPHPAPIRHDWTDAELQALADLPLLDLVYRAAGVHRACHDPADVQRATLLSVKTGGCPEDCAYCPQSARYATGVQAEALLDVEVVLAAARAAKDDGASRFCMGAAWRSVKDGPQFDAVLAMVRGVRALGMEACVTLGMLEPHQARALAEAGLTAYNHNLDSGPDFYPRIIHTRTYEDRLRTLDAVEAAGIGVCCGGIVGMGETRADRVAMLGVLARRDPHPESVPINALVSVAGTPLGGRPAVDGFEVVRAVAVARIAMPRARVRLSAGRKELGAGIQALAFMAGANSVFTGEKLLTTPNAAPDDDEALFAALF